MKAGKSIVTRTRYGFAKAVVLINVLMVEAVLLFSSDIDYSSYGYSKYMYISYLLMLVFFVVRGNTGRVYLKYELGLSIMLKTILVNIIFTPVLVSTGAYASGWHTLLKITMLTVLNIISIVIINLFWVSLLKKNGYEYQDILYICPAGHTYKYMYAVSENEPLKIIEENIKQHDAVYLCDIEHKNKVVFMELIFKHGKIMYSSANLSDIMMKASGLAQDEDAPVYYCTNFGIGGVSSIIKRMIDIAGSIAGIIITLPVCIIVALCIKLEDGGEILFKQVRCTKDNREFVIFKFRSMSVKENGKAVWATDEQDRITRTGRFIRKFKLDELPQLINILKGDMSIVGPRPEQPQLIKKAIADVPEFELRTKVKAGLTGYAQVRGKYDTSFNDKLMWDLIYIENYSVMLDIKIIIMTVASVIEDIVNNKAV